MIGRVVGSYRIVEKIGEGGMGAVYRAVDEMLEREVAIKAIRPALAREPEIVERFRSEAKILARIHHPAIATIYSFFHDGGELFLAMEYVYGRPLSTVLTDGGALPWRRAVTLVASALDGIEQAHRAGIIHRDLKPDNLMLTPADTLKVMDFGIARMPGSGHLTRTGLLIGTLRYIAPEQIRGEEVDRRTDVYALGVVLYQMLTGQVPFDGPTDFLILKAQLEEPPSPPSALAPDVPPWLDRIVLRALAKSPADRFQTVEELRTYLAGGGSLAVSPDADLPTLALPPRPAAPSPETVETDHPRLPAGAPTAEAPPPARQVPGTSYRPVGEAGGKRGIAVSVVSALVLGIGLAAFLGSRVRNELERDAAPASRPAPASIRPATPAAAGPAAQPAEPLPSAAAPPISPFPTPAQRPPRPPASQPEAGPQTSAAPSQPAPAAPEPAPAPEEPLPQGLSQLTSQLVERSEKLLDVYKEFLDRKEDAGAELTDADEQLKDEIDNLAAAADRFNKRVNERFFVRAWDRLKRQDQPEAIRRRAQDIAGAVGRIDRLMAQVRPSADVRQEWQEVRHRWTRVAEILPRGA
jgi:serine/threonine-protein kinase